MKATELIKLAKEQNVIITSDEVKKWKLIIAIVQKNRRDISARFDELRENNFEIYEKPINTGHGVGTCIKRMRNGELRIRVSANWGGRQGNYASCVII